MEKVAHIKIDGLNRVQASIIGKLAESGELANFLNGKLENKGLSIHMFEPSQKAQVKFDDSDEMILHTINFDKK